MKPARFLTLALLLCITGCYANFGVATLRDSGTPTSGTKAGAFSPVTATPTRISPTAVILPTQGRQDSVPTSATLRVKLYLVALNTATGTPVGCGDSLITVERDIPHTASPLTDTLALLFAIKTQYYGQSGLYNALYQSDLHVNGISAHNGVFKVDLGGTVTLGGECDSPRFEAQITQTILQFSTVQQADVTINGKPLKDILSSK